MSLLTQNKQYGQGDDPLREMFAVCKSAFVAAALFSFVVNLMILTMPLYMFSLFDRVLGSGNLFTLAMLFSIAMVSLLVQALVDIARTYVFVQMSSWMDRQIGERLLTISIRNSVPRGNPKSTDLLNKLSSLRTFLAGQQVYTLMDAPWVPVFLGILFILNFWIGLTATSIAMILGILAIVNKVITDPALDAASKAATKAQTTANSTAQNADVVEAMGMRLRLLALWSVDNEKALDVQSIASRRSGIIQAFVKMMRMLSMMGVMTVAAVQIIDPESGLSRGAMMASVILVSRCLMPIEGLVSGWDGIKASITNYKYIAKALRDDNYKIEEKVTPVEPKGEIKARNLIFQPRGVEKAILNRVSLALNPGESLAIIGPSASGKSTLARLLVGLETPTFGDVRIDGVNITDWPSEELGQYLGYLPQDVELFNGTIRDNISRFAPDFDKEAILEAAEMAGVHKMIQKMPHGYETEIGPKGAILSGGQQQRIGLARALYGNVKVVVLDEPNANLDVAGEQALAEAIEALKKAGVTVVVILHRPNILRVIDYIMVLNDGSIQKMGPREEMLPVIEGRAPRKEVEGEKVQAISS